MTERVLELVRALGGAGQEDALGALCAAACGALDRRLRPGAWRPLTDGETAALLAEKNLQELV